MLIESCPLQRFLSTPLGYTHTVRCRSNCLIISGEICTLIVCDNITCLWGRFFDFFNKNLQINNLYIAYIHNPLPNILTIITIFMCRIKNWINHLNIFLYCYATKYFKYISKEFL